MRLRVRWQAIQQRMHTFSASAFFLPVAVGLQVPARLFLVAFLNSIPSRGSASAFETVSPVRISDSIMLWHHPPLPFKCLV